MPIFGVLYVCSYAVDIRINACYKSCRIYSCNLMENIICFTHICIKRTVASRSSNQKSKNVDLSDSALGICGWWILGDLGGGVMLEMVLEVSAQKFSA